jgi:L-fuculose-phosphate aldolase
VRFSPPVGADLEAIGVAICAACRELHRRDLLAATDGNISVRLADGRIIITPAGVNKARLEPRQLSIMSSAGKVLIGNPSAERALHLSLYAAAPAAHAIVHAHPPAAVAWTLARPTLTELPADLLPEVILATGGIPIVPYARAGTTALADAIIPFLPAHRALILARHGAVTWGDDLDEAVDAMERLDHVARTLALAVQIGGAALTPLDPAELTALRALRAQAPPRTR